MTHQSKSDIISTVPPTSGVPPMGNTTRYLCAAAYVDAEFRDKVLTETLLDPFRAVSPSYGGFDLMPVIHHCNHSRSMLLVRDAIITCCLVLGLVLSPFVTVVWLVILLPFALLSLESVRRGPVAIRAVLWIWAVLSIAQWLLSGLLLALFSSLVFAPSTGYLDEGLGLSSLIGGSAGALLIPAASICVALAYRVGVYRTLAGSLRPGTPPPPVHATDYKARRRLDYLDQAQWGNVTMYATEDPFLGAGEVRRSWSIAVELDRVRQPHSAAPRSRLQDSPVDVDPVELHSYVRNRLVGMRERVLRPREGIDQLDIGDHVLVRGIFTVADWEGRRQPHPMLDKDGMPRHRLSSEEIAAIIRHPQGGVRYYQRVTVGNTGQEIRDEAGALVAPAADQEALTSAFIYLAVEGRMLYTQFVVTVLPPAAGPYHVVDQLPTMTGRRVAWEALKAVRLGIVRDVLAAPVRLTRAGFQAVRQSMSIPDPREHLVYPYGARLSVRELGASAGLQTFVQTLDVAKYTRMIEQRLTEAVLDYLEERQIDTGAYRLQAASVTMNNTVNVGADAATGPIAVGHQATATVTTMQ